MRRNNDNAHDKNEMQLKSLVRIKNIPIVEQGWGFAEDLYWKIKKSNSLANWSFTKAEMTFNTAFDSALPITLILFSGPINTIDSLLCKSLDIAEERVPFIYYPPKMMFGSTKTYINNNLVSPVLRRADSVKQLGSTVLTNKYTEMAADTLDGALDVADKYVEKYLPPEKGEIEDTKPIDDHSKSKAVNTIHHVDRFSRKLTRRITQHTLAEAKHLKEQSAEAIHVLIYVVELIATDPKLAMAKAKQLWISLSKDEPENQARPDNLEELVVLLTRESARRIVHLINYTSEGVQNLPKTITRTARKLTQQFVQIADSLVKTVHLDGAKNVVTDEVKSQVGKLRVLLHQLNVYVSNSLEWLAKTIAGSDHPPVTNNKHSLSSELDNVADRLAAGLSGIRRHGHETRRHVTRFVNDVTSNGGY